MVPRTGDVLADRVVLARLRGTDEVLLRLSDDSVSSSVSSVFLPLRVYVTSFRLFLRPIMSRSSSNDTDGRNKNDEERLYASKPTFFSNNLVELASYI